MKGFLNRLAAMGALVAGVVAFAQAGGDGTQDAGAKEFAYDVVSIRQCIGQAPVQVQFTDDGFSANCTPLWTLLFHAYAPEITTGDQVKGLPEWANSTRWTVQAKMDPDTMAAFQKLPPKDQAEQRKLMLLSILTDRFQMKLHQESKERPGYDLVIAKNGPKVEGMKPGERPGGANMRSGRIDVRGMPIAAFTQVLTHVVGRPVVDKTGLTGQYDITVTYAPEEPIAPQTDAPSLFTALEEQLVLKLVPSKASVSIFVIDLIDRPSEN